MGTVPVSEVWDFDIVSMSNAQKLFFNDKDAGTLSGQNAGAFKGVQVDPSKIKTSIFQWDSNTGTFVVK